MPRLETERLLLADLGRHRVQGRHFVRYAASGRVMQKLGMRLEGTHRDAFSRWSRFEDVAAYAVLKQEWTPLDGASLPSHSLKVAPTVDRH